MDRPRGAEARRAGRGISALAALLASAGLAFMPFGPAPVLATDSTANTIVDAAESSAPDATTSTEATTSSDPVASDPTPSTSPVPDASADTSADTSAGASVSDASPADAPAEPYGPPAPDVTAGSATTGDPSAGTGPLLIGPPAFSLVVEGRDAPASQAFGPAGAPLTDLARYTAFRVRFVIENADSVAVELFPTLEWRGPGLLRFARVPALEPLLGDPFYVTREWGPDLLTVGGFDEPGTILGATGETLETGYVSTGENPAPPLAIPPGEARTVEFSLRATTDAAYLATYELRLTDGGTVVADAATGRVATGPQPAPLLTPGQRHGTPGDELASAAVAAAYPLVAAARPAGATLASYRLAVPAPASASVTHADELEPADSIHGPYSLATDACAACHSTHRSRGAVLSAQPTQYATCTTCHGADASAGAANVVDDYATVTAANDATTRSYYAHPLVATGHTLDENDPLAGALNRHAECADCHQPHRARTTDGTTGTDASTGAPVWLTSGRLLGVRGVKVVNGVAGTAPAYTLRVAESDTPEYEICLKCHAGYTTQLPNDPAHPSRDREDLGVVLNPATGSYHPLESAGTNATVAMGNGLLGTSPYKLWDWSTESVIRCSNCHGNALPTGVTLGDRSAGSSLPAHASANRGILLAPYRDRQLKAAYDAYSSGDFALCYLCHAEAPFVDVSGNARTDTNFRYHGLHVSGLAGKGSGGLDIDDSSGAGQGNAICAECHFRPHGTASAPGADDTTNSRLVAFAPNVGTVDGTRRWTLAAEGTSGTCTLTCHGKPHSTADAAYDAVNASAFPVTLSIASDAPSFSDGTTMTFTYTLTNTSRADLSVGAFAVTSSRGGACTTEPADPFRPGDATTCTGTYTATSGDVEATALTVTASGSDGTYLTSTGSLTLAWVDAVVPTSASAPDGFDLGAAIATILFGGEPGDAGPWDGPASKTPDLAANDRPTPLRRSTAARPSRRRPA